MRRFVFLLLSVVTVSACAGPGTYSYTPPSGSKGAGCVQECAARQEACVQLEGQAYDLCNRNKIFDQRVYEDCAHARGQEGGCRPPTYCPPPNTPRCVKEYNACYTACGGTVTEGG